MLITTRPRWDPKFRRNPVAALRLICAVALTAIAPSRLHAELRLDGSREAVVLQAKEAALGEVLAALAGKFDVRVKSSTTPDGVVDGTYAGPLTAVIAKLLDSYNYVLAPRAAHGHPTLDIILIGRKAPGQPVAPIVTRTTPETPADQWRKIPVKTGR
jgi:hypothetical protein